MDERRILPTRNRIGEYATVAANRGRPTREVAAEFLTKKLWAEFAGTDIPAGVLTAGRQAAIAGDQGQVIGEHRSFFGLFSSRARSPFCRLSCRQCSFQDSCSRSPPCQNSFSGSLISFRHAI